MKKILLPLFATAMLFAACENDQDVALELTQQKGVTFIVPDFQNADGTRMAVDIDASGATFTWTAGDTIGVFPANGYQTAFPISGGEGTNTAVFDGADWALRPSASYAAYYPFKPGMDFGKENISVSYLGQTQDGNGSTAHLGNYDYLASVFTSVDGAGNATFEMKHLGCLLRLILYCPIASAYSKLVIISNDVEIDNRVSFNLGAAAISYSSLQSSNSLSLNLEGISNSDCDEPLEFYMMLPPTSFSGKETIIKIQASEEEEYYCTVDFCNMSPGKAYSYTAHVTTPVKEYEINSIDLGLPSGTLWANMNVGASHTLDYGSLMNRGNLCYPFGDNLGGVPYSIIGTEYDVAMVNLGPEWRTPAEEQIQELKQYCFQKWYKDYLGTGIAGVKFTGPNGKNIFLPAAGQIDARDGTNNNVNISGVYWSGDAIVNDYQGWVSVLYFREGIDDSNQSCFFAYGKGSYRAVISDDMHDYVSEENNYSREDINCSFCGYQGSERDGVYCIQCGNLLSNN